MPITPEIVTKLLELKEQSGLNFEQIGIEVGTSAANARRYIIGDTKTPDRKLLFQIVRTIGGDPEALFAPKPTPGASAPVGMDYALYDRLLSNMEARYAHQEQAHQEAVAKLTERHERELATLNSWIDRFRSERDQIAADLRQADKTRRLLLVIILILSVVVCGFVAVYLIPDLLRGDWGHIQY